MLKYTTVGYCFTVKEWKRQNKKEVKKKGIEKIVIFSFTLWEFSWASCCVFSVNIVMSLLLMIILLIITGTGSFNFFFCNRHGDVDFAISSLDSNVIQ